MTKTYDVTCPDPECAEEFEVELDPETEEDCIECPECLEEFDWEHDSAADTITLMSDEEDDDETDDTLTIAGDDGEDELP